MAGAYFKGGKLVGAGSDGDTDTFLTQTFDNVSITDFVQTGLALETASSISGSTSAKLIHQSAANQSFKETKLVPEKFRGVSMTVSITAKSAASLGNVIVLFRDETNNSDIQTTQQISSTANVVGIYQFGVKIPANCLSFSYTITALPEAGSPITYIDDITIRSFWLGSSIQGQTDYRFETPIVTDWVDYVPVGSFTSNVAYTGKWRRVGDTIEVRTQLTFSAAPNATSFTLNLPNGWSYDTTKMTANAHHEIVGEVTWQDIGVQNYSGWISPVSGNSTQVIAYYGSGSATHNYGTSSQSGPMAIGASDVIVLNYRLPVSGWTKTEFKNVTMNDLVPSKAMAGNTSIAIPVITAWKTYVPTTQGFTFSSSVFQWRQNGSSIEIKGKGTVATASAVEARLGLPNNYTSESTINSIQVVGTASRGNGTSNAWSALIEPSVNYLTFGVYSGSSGLDPSVKQNGDSLFVTGSSFTFSVEASVEIKNLNATETKTWSATQSVVTQEKDSYLRITNFIVAYGSSATRIISLSNGGIVQQNMGDAIQYLDDTVNGARFIAQKEGLYRFGFSTDISSSTPAYVGFSLNTTGLSTDFNNLPASQRLNAGDDIGGNSTVAVSTEAYLLPGDVIRLHGHSPLSGANTFSAFTAAYQGGTKQIQTVSDQKISIPTHELKLEGSSSRGSVATGIAKFDTIAKLRGDAFTVVSNTTDGTYIQMRKAGRLSASVSMLLTSAGSYLVISKNQVITTAFPLASEIMASDVTANVANYGASASGTFDVAVNDIIRIYAHSTPSAMTINGAMFSLQEQSVAVAVTNTLPQFSDSDSQIRAYNAIGWGTGTFVRRFATIQEIRGTDIELGPNDAVNGTHFLIKTAGTYCINYSDAFAAAVSFGFTRNGASLTSLANHPTSVILSVTTTSGVDSMGSTTWQGYLEAGDVIRPHTNNAATTGNASYSSFTISKVGKPNVTGVNVTPFINAPQLSRQSISFNGGTAANVTDGFAGEWQFVVGIFKNAGDSLISIVDDPTNSLTKFVALKKVYVNAYFSAGIPSLGNLVYIYKNGSQIAYGNHVSTATYNSTASVGISLEAGDYISFGSSGTYYSSGPVSVSILASANTDQILTLPETFSTDSAPLVYAPASKYTLTTLADAPIGTFITYTYALNTNTRVQTSAAPNQSTADMNANGFAVYTRLFNASSTAGQPSTIAIQIGRGHKGMTLSSYRFAGKVTVGSLDYLNFSSTAEYGLWCKEYDEKTGIVMIDAGIAISSSITVKSFLFTDLSSVNSAYISINASKNPAMTGMNNPIIAARGVNSSGQSIPNNLATAVTFDAAETFDTTGSLNTATGVYTAPENGYYKISAGCLYTSIAWAAGTFADLYVYKNGVVYSDARYLVSAAVSSNVGVTISDDLFLAKGDTVTLMAYHQRGAATTLFASGNWNFFSIVKVR